MSFRNDVRDPLQRLLKRPAFRRLDPTAVKAVLADPAKMNQLEVMVEKRAINTGASRRLRARADEPAAGRFQRFFAWIIENQDAILGFIRAIMAMFGAMQVQTIKGMSWQFPTKAQVSSDEIAARLRGHKPKPPKQLK